MTKAVISQALASLRVEQGRPDEALALLRQSMQLWWHDTDDPSAAAHDADQQPSYEFRFESAKLLLELDETVNTAIEVLESLLEENDSVPDVYQLLAMCLFGGGEHQEVCGVWPEHCLSARSR